MNDNSNIRPYRDLEHVLGNLLRYGVIIAGAIVLVGGIIFLFRHGFSVPQYRNFQEGPNDLRHIPGIFKNAFSLEGEAVIQMGFLFLIATPIARVAFSIYAFAREHDIVYVAISIFVLAVLIFGLAGGHL